jgi:hypothetical protein
MAVAELRPIPDIGNPRGPHTPLMNAPFEPPHCRIEQSLGRSEICPGASCPFWERDAGVNGSGCLFGNLDLAGRKDLAGWLHDLRDQLDTYPASDEVARRSFFGRLNAGRSD